MCRGRSTGFFTSIILYFPSGNSFNVNDYKEVIEFAKAANGGRPVPVEG